MLRIVGRISGSVACVGLITWIYFRLLPANSTTVALTYFLAILIIAANWGLAEAVIASVGAMLSFNFFFLPPIGTFVIADPQNWIALTVFLLTSVIASHLSVRARLKSVEADNRREEVEKLYTFSRNLMLVDHQEPLGRQIAEQINKTFSIDAVAVYDHSTGETFYAGPKDFPVRPGRLQDVALQGTITQEAGDKLVLVPIQLGGKPVGSMGMEWANLSDTALYAIANLLAIAFERAHHLRLASQAEAARRSQELKSTLLDAIAHEFKTPLTSIKGAVTALLCAPPADLDSTELLTVIDEETDRINFLVSETIEMARLEAADIQVHKEICSLANLVQISLQRLRSLIEGRTIEIELPERMPDCLADPVLIKMVITHLLGNAIKYCPSSAPIKISAETQNDFLLVHVIDQGPGIPEDQLGKIFEKYYRLPDSRNQVSGTGLGLYIARRIVEAHGGRMWASSRPGRGSCFSFSLPTVEKASQP